MYKLTESQLQAIVDRFKQFNEIEKVILFGSRALENSKPGSDVDLFIAGSKVSPHLCARLAGILNDETAVPFQFDVICEPLETDLKNHISEFGKIIFLRDPKKDDT